MTESEREVFRTLTGSGYRLLKTGWPDFLAISPAGHVVAVEVKRHTDEPSVDQLEMHEALASAGINTVIAIAGGGLFVEEFQSNLLELQRASRPLRDRETDGLQ